MSAHSYLFYKDLCHGSSLRKPIGQLASKMQCISMSIAKDCTCWAVLSGLCHA